MDQYRTEQVEDDEPPAGVRLDAGGNQTVSNSQLAGRDITNDHSTTHNDNSRRMRIGLGGLAVVLLLGGGVVAYNALSGPDGAMYEKGLAGAQHTAEQLRQAEIDRDSANWCLLASSNDSKTCHTMMGLAFASGNPLRAKLTDVRLGTATGNADTASIPISVDGSQLGVVPMRWDGKRWELNPAAYALMLNNGGMAMSALETQHGCGALGGFTIGCKK